MIKLKLKYIILYSYQKNIKQNKYLYKIFWKKIELKYKIF